ncbi:hypothetical protein VD0002_g7926 [Verticillium dahliae]|uniref:Uncharacterized protein n=1 Tax=Verticillium dahliae TaxID=27337 RepID=A0A2J8EDP7_VERDA|nr:hypothetical protein VdG2_09298 [Verticillium dahliae VDG2]KAF3358962.1 hypothetical protein VdG1_02524 [Verticillium dahliae VDG1]KAH6697876.1 hypothetical protein EV126DRAFT_515311 [Verticillium dahliae]PNH36075.1 hypothetical protein BJF96_g670 [Verticillium dahliae]PNH38247.1 hypothetical protein VD0004_g8576 [Verticillium dahliae]
MKLLFVTSLFLAAATALPANGDRMTEREADCAEDCVERLCMGFANLDYVACMLSE